MSSYPTYEEWKQTCLIIYQFPLTLFLSYLWGMETITHLFLVTFFPNSSYPTYEEWKQLILIKIFKSISCSYPTYEEWKPGVSSIATKKSPRSYPTYEEWKLSSFLPSCFSSFVFLSYLWGMETYSSLSLLGRVLGSYPTYEEWKLG